MRILKVKAITVKPLRAPTLRMQRLLKQQGSIVTPARRVYHITHEIYEIEYFVNAQGEMICDSPRKCKNCKGLQECVRRPPPWIERRRKSI